MKNAAGWKESTKLSLSEFDGLVTMVNEDLRRLLVAKRESYGPFNLAKFGDDGVLIRTSDKLERLIHMYQNDMEMTVVKESALDAWRDIAGYAILVLVTARLGQREHAETELKITTESKPTY